MKNQNIDATTIGERIRRIRTDNRLTQEGFVECLSLHHDNDMALSPSDLSKIENGEKPPKVYLIVDICTEFGVSADWLVMGKPAPVLPAPLEALILQLADEIRAFHSGK